MEKDQRVQEKMGLAGKIREGFGESLRSLSKIEDEGEKLFRGLVDMVEKVGLDAGTKAVEDLRRDAQAFLNQLNETIEERAQAVLEGLNVPTRQDLEQYNRKMRTLIEDHLTARMERLKVPTGREFDAMAKQLRVNLEEQISKGLHRLNVATKKDVDTVAADVKSLKKDVAGLARAKVTKKPAAAKTVAKKTSAKKVATARKKPAKKR